MAPKSKGYHTVDTLSIKEKNNIGVVNIEAEGASDDINIRVIPKGDGYIILDRVNDLKIDGTLTVAHITGFGCCGIYLEGTIVKEGNIIAKNIKANSLSINTMVFNQSTSGQFFTVNDGETGSGITKPGLLAGFAIDRGIVDDFLMYFDDNDDVFKMHLEGCCPNNFHSSETVTKTRVPDAF